MYAIRGYYGTGAGVFAKYNGGSLPAQFLRTNDLVRLGVVQQATGVNARFVLQGSFAGNGFRVGIGAPGGHFNISSQVREELAVQLILKLEGFSTGHHSYNFV